MDPTVLCAGPLCPYCSMIILESIEVLLACKPHKVWSLYAQLHVPVFAKVKLKLFLRRLILSYFIFYSAHKNALMPFIKSLHIYRNMNELTLCTIKSHTGHINMSLI